MIKAIFHPNEIKPSKEKVLLELPKNFAPEEEEPQDEAVLEPVYEGPTVDDLRREAEEWRSGFELEKEKRIAAANDEANRIVKEAEAEASEQARQKAEEADAALQKARDEAARIEAEARERAAKIEEDARQAMDAQKKEAYDAGFAEGREAGFESGKEETSRLIDRLHSMIEGVLERRQKILDETEQQIVDLVLLMTRKVVKAISENNKAVVAANVIQALKKLKGKHAVTLRVNLKDQAFVSSHIRDFISAVEAATSISVAEDSSVDPGGCIVETDFGEVDARIMSQLDELEEKILEISPLRSRQRLSPASQNQQNRPPASPAPSSGQG